MTDESRMSQDNLPSAEAAPEKTELDLLKERANIMGLSYHPSIGPDKLKAKIEDKLNENKNVTAAEGADDPVLGAPDNAMQINQATVLIAGKPATAETRPQKVARLRKEALRLIRCRVTCMNPNKRDWEGEVITVSNSFVGTERKYVPFNAEEGWHVPHIIFEQLQQRQCQVFYTQRDRGTGAKKRMSKLIKEFAIEVLPPLTRDELKDLALRQASEGTIHQG